MAARSWRSCGAIFDIEQREARARELEGKMADPGFWDDQEKAQRVVTDLKALRRIYEPYQELLRQVDDAEGMAALLAQEPDESIAVELEEQSKSLLPRIHALEMRSLLSEESDAHGAIVTIHPGAGGTESQDWAQMLFRMYTRYLERKGLPSQVLDLQPGEEAGIKDATVEVDAPFSYGYLKAERGVHRLVRISPYDANHRRHTSFASVFVYPLAEGNGDLQVPESELRIDTFRASGAGGQHVNKTESAVRITHVPTGIVVQCQNERSQHKNKRAAMGMLEAKLYQLRETEKDKELKKAYGEKAEIDFGYQIRSYVMAPYQQVKDLRTDFVTSDVAGMLDGEIQTFLDVHMKQRANERNKTR